MPDRSIGKHGRSGVWDDEDEEAVAPWRRLSRDEADALRASQPQLSPWWVIAAQVLVGVVAALAGGLVTGRSEVAWSLLYGAAAVVVPGALMARGMTSRLTGMNAGTSAVSFMWWELVKIAVSLAMLVLANRVVRPLVWPALLVGLVVCMKVYWVALLWRGRKKN
jgi:ATP synthase protein I